MTDLRGKNLNPEMSRRVLSLYNTEHYSEAVLAAFKVVEERLRVITAKPDADRKELLKETFNPTTGTLHDREAWQSERSGIYNFIDGAFLSFRNPHAHRFVETDGEKAFDLIVLANRILLLIEERYQRLGVEPKKKQSAENPSPALLGLLQSMYAFEESDDIWTLDTNNDGSDEIVTPSYVRDGQVINIEHYSSEDGFSDGILESVEPDFSATDVLLADVDNDGRQEVVCVALAAYDSLTLFYRYRDGKYEILRKDPNTAPMEGSDTPWFFNAQVVDIDGDGKMEVVSEPKQIGYLPTPARYIWKWDEEAKAFRLLSMTEYSKGT